MDNNRPLRNSSNFKKDLKNVYGVKKESNLNKSSEDEELFEELIEEKVGAAMEFEDMANNKGLNEEPIPNEIIGEELNTLESSSELYKKEVDHLKDQLARRIAEMENMRKRNERERSELIQFANQKLLQNLLEIPDTIKQALNASNKAGDYDSLKKGIELIYNKTIKLFEEAGVKPMEDAAGQEFNVDQHEALMHTTSPTIPEGNIIQVVQDGYLYHGKVIRHAKVITSSGKE